jgi:hypothetical protein
MCLNTEALWPKSMAEISQEIFLAPKHVSKHLRDAGILRRLLLRGRAIHVFNPKEMMMQVAQATIG